MDCNGYVWRERDWAAKLWALATIVAAATRCSAGAAERHGGSYQKQDAYKDQDFLDKFDFLDSSAPDDGHVSYLNRTYAQESGVAQALDGNVFLCVDASGVTGGARRKSVRISSKAVYNSGLFVLSLEHLPTGCGIWPTFWLKGSDDSGPQGSINIIEGVHSMTNVKTTLHTSAGCDQSSVKSRKDFSGVWVRGSTKPEANDCFNNAPGQWKDQGCEQNGPSGSIGKPFNDDGGGTFVTEWKPNSGHIQVWLFNGSALPPDLAAGTPDPESWGKPYSFFRLSEDTCSKRHFTNMSMVFDLNLCGSYGDALFQAMCPLEASKSGSCNNYVSDHPKQMQHAYWSIRSLDVYQWRNAQGGHTTTAGLGNMLDAGRAPVPQNASAAVNKTRQVTTPGATSTVSHALRNPQTLTTSNSPPPVAIPKTAMRKVALAKAAAVKASAAGRQSIGASGQETSHYLHDAVPEPKKDVSLISGLLHFFQPAAHTNAATHLAGGIPTMKGGTVEQTDAGGPPAKQVTKTISPATSLFVCSAAVALGIFAFWAKMGSLASVFARSGGQRVSTSQVDSPSVHGGWDEVSSRRSISSSNVGVTNPRHEDSDARSLVVPRNDMQPALLDFLEADDSEDVCAH